MRASDLTLEQVAQEALACPLLVAAQALAEWIGQGKPITGSWVLKPAAAIEACDLLGIETPARKLRSAGDIPQLVAVWTAARGAGFIELSNTKVMASPALRAWREGDPGAVVAIWTQGARAWFGLDDADPDEEALEHLATLVTLDDHGGSAPLEDLRAGIERLLGGIPSCSCPDCAPSPLLPGVFADFDGYGESDARAAVRMLGEFGVAVLRDGLAELTLLGNWLADFTFRQSAPSADAEAEVLVSALAQVPDLAATVLARPWLSSRTPADAGDALLAAAEAMAGRERLTAVTLARECGAAAESTWRRWAVKGGIGAYARIWLAEQEGVEPVDADIAWLSADALVAVVDALPPDFPEEVTPGFLLAQFGDDLIESLSLIERSGHPEAPRLTKLFSAGSARPRSLTPLPGPVRGGSVDATYQIKVQLVGVTKPPVWRRIQVSAGFSLDQLHDVIQDAMGWFDCHLHKFSDEWREYGDTDPELGYFDERTVRLSQLLAETGDKIHYTYDFGDNWDHVITLEKVLPPDVAAAGPSCTAGKGACPPEDCGGSWGYADLKNSLADPEAEDHEDLLEWLGLASGDEFDPHAFSVGKVSARLGRPNR
ncbi:plasmid pRiA4b ORF-3 family protein [Amycolatopsis sp. cg5]|uniref:plasmid pRiA4b ORF-3 family protein n=1 Tax=Amycolatopsis sp. cg5 TaxID=3238802 RepID=UPI0035268698